MSDKLPAYALAEVFRVRDQLFQLLKREYTGIEFTGDLLETLVGDVCCCLPKRALEPAVRDTLRQHLGTVMHPKFLLDLAWRLAGNLPGLKAGRPAVPWKAPGMEEWAPLQVTRVSPAAPRRGVPQHRLRLRILAGTACPLEIDKDFHRRSLATIAGIVGFTHLRGGRPFSWAEEFVGLRFYGKLEPKQGYGMPGFFEVRCPASCKEHNLQVLKLRFRQGLDCPRQFTHDCTQCPIGYKECLAGVHAETFVTLLCSVCGQPKLMDPELSKVKCRQCCIAHQLKGEPV